LNPADRTISASGFDFDHEAAIAENFKPGERPKQNLGQLGPLRAPGAPPFGLRPPPPPSPRPLVAGGKMWSSFAGINRD